MHIPPRTVVVKNERGLAGNPTILFARQSSQARTAAAGKFAKLMPEPLAIEALALDPGLNRKTDPPADSQITRHDEEQARAKLVVQFIPHLRRYARALLRDRYAADDLVQDTLQRAANKLRLWQPGSDMRAWLFTVMHNVFVNQKRKHRPEIAFGSEELPEAAIPTQVSGVELAEIEKALQRLAAEQREVLLMIAIEQMSYNEVAKALSIPIGTVMSRLSRARDRMRRLLNGTG